MLKISRLTVENLKTGCVTDNPKPRFSYCVESDRTGVEIKRAQLKVGNWKTDTLSQIAVPYGGAALQPFTRYQVVLDIWDDAGETAQAQTEFETGRLGMPWEAEWITDISYHFNGPKVSPKPITFRKRFVCGRGVKSARLYVTALGIYELEMNGRKVGEDYFAPGFTSYRHHLQYQTYDVTGQLQKQNELTAVVAGGWAVGAFTYKRRNRVYARRQALLCELRVVYTDGSQKVIGTDETWEVTREGSYREAEFYNGEVYDGAVDLENAHWSSAGAEKLRIHPELTAQTGAPVRAHETLEPVSVKQAASGELVYDFGQNFAGVICARLRGKKGQKVVFRHAEILMDGELYTKPLRTARQEAVYLCRDGQQTYSPRLTYMGFRYVGVTGIRQENLELTALALYSDVEDNGSFSCSNDLLNRLQSNIRWGAKSNFVDIPTDCPQRDERMGWTGDIALFSPTAAYNFNMSRFLEKWLRDVMSEQTRGGGIPVTVPLVRVPLQWEIMIPMAVDHWGDACILVPWAEYQARGDLGLLRKLYPTMKRYLKACTFWAGLFSFGRGRRIWKLLHHYGDWCAPGVSMWGWMKRGKWTATACLAHSAALLSEIAGLLGEQEDADRYRKLNRETAQAYRELLMREDCTVKKEFQTAYVLPLYYDLLSEGDARKTAGHLARMIRENDYHIATGFPGTPYVLFALADNGYQEDAYRMLLTDTCPSWLYEVKVGGTTVWERWDALREDGSCNTGEKDGTGGMVSFNHYENGALGDFLYRRIAGIEPVEGGYRSFRIAPVPGGGLTWAQGSVQTAYGRIFTRWEIRDGRFFLEAQVPPGTTCHLCTPGGDVRVLCSGRYTFEEGWNAAPVLSEK